MPQNTAAESQGAGADLPESRQLSLALALGWTIAESAGRYRHGIHPRNPQAGKVAQDRQIPRFTYASKALQSNNDLFWLLSQRLITLAEALKLDQLQPSEGKKKTTIDMRIKALPEEIRKHIAKPGSTQALKPQEFYQLLEDWSQLARLELGVRSTALREAFSFGGQVANLYWALLVPDRPNLARWPNRWQAFVGQVSEVLTDLERIKASLPLYVETALVHSLSYWREIRPSWLEEEPSFEQARGLWSGLARQAVVWGELLMEEREPLDYLTVVDRRWITVLSTLAFVILLVLIVVSLSTAVVGLSQWVALVLVPWVRAWWQQTPPGTQVVTVPSLEEWLSVGGVLVAVGGALYTASVAFARRLGDIYRWLRDHIAVYFVQRRTLVKWEET